jgi:hypothetical protein
MKLWPVKMIGSKNVTGQEEFLVGHCPLTGRYFEPCLPCTEIGNFE